VLDTFIYSIAAADASGVPRWANETWAIYYRELLSQ
jgi:hypothetical protein